MSESRSHFARLPQELRCLIYARHLAGDANEVILNDPKVARAVHGLSVPLTTHHLVAAYRSAEYNRYAGLHARHLAAVESEKMTRSILESLGALESVTDVARYELAGSIRRLIARGPDEDHSDLEHVERLTRSLAAVTRDESARLKAEIAGLREELNLAEVELARLRELVAVQGGKRVADELDKSVGLLPS